MTMTFERGPANPQPVSQISFTPSHIGTDPAAYLPAAAADRFRTLKQHADDLHKLMPPLEERQEAHNAKMQTEQVLKRLQAHASTGGFELPDDDPRCVGEKAKLDALVAECRRVDGIYEARLQAWRAASQTVSAVTAYLLDGRPAGTVLARFQRTQADTEQGRGHHHRRGKASPSCARIEGGPQPHCCRPVLVELLPSKGKGTDRGTGCAWRTIGVTACRA